MKIVLISGLSGSGKSVALKQLEDLGYFCVDNLPLEMLPSLVLHHIERADETKLGVSVDVRSGINIQEAQEQIQYLRDEGHQVEVLFVEAEESVLVRRFSETRRGHPLSGILYHQSKNKTVRVRLKLFLDSIREHSGCHPVLAPVLRLKLLP